MKCPCGKAYVKPGTRCPACSGVIMTGDMLIRAARMVDSQRRSPTEPIRDVLRRVRAKYGIVIE